MNYFFQKLIQQIRELFEELEFKTILQRVLSLSDNEFVKIKKQMF